MIGNRHSDGARDKGQCSSTQNTTLAAENVQPIKNKKLLTKEFLKFESCELPLLMK